MRTLAGCVLGGGVLLLAMTHVALPGGPGMSVFSPASRQPDALTLQYNVNRTAKSDRLPARFISDRGVKPRKPVVRERTILIGCDPAFSPLTGGVNFTGRCLVENMGQGSSVLVG